jgi:hypothetical protein
MAALAIGAAAGTTIRGRAENPRPRQADYGPGSAGAMDAIWITVKDSTS